MRCWFVCTVILSPKSLNIRISSFLSLSHSLPDRVLTTARPSSRYNPTFSPNLSCNEFSINRPTNSQTSAPSKLPIVTSKTLSVLRLDHD